MEQFYPLDFLMEAWCLPQNDALAKLKELNLRPVVDGRTGKTVFPAAPVASDPAILGLTLSRSEALGCPVPLLLPEALEPVSARMPGAQRNVTPQRDLLRRLPWFPGLRANSYLEPNANPHNKKKPFNPPLTIYNRELALRLLTDGYGKFFKVRMGAGCYLDALEIVRPEFCRPPAEGVWRRAAAEWMKFREIVAPNLPKRDPAVFVPPAKKKVKVLTQPDREFAFAAQDPEERFAYKPKLKILALDIGPKPGNPATWKSWLTPTTLEMAIATALRYADILQEEHLGLRRTLTNWDYLDPAHAASARHITDDIERGVVYKPVDEPIAEQLPGAPVTEAHYPTNWAYTPKSHLRTDQEHRRQFAAMQEEWRRDAEAWEGSIFQQILPKDFRLVFR